MSPPPLSVIIRTRRSIRRYTERAVPRALLERLLEAACWAPSAHNRQPWRFAVILDAGQRASLAAAMGERFREDLSADGLAADAVDRQVARSYERISGAPVVVVVCVSLAEMDSYPDERRQRAERTMAVQSAALAAQNLLLAAHAEGLGACWMCAPLFCPERVREALGLPADWDPQALITLGYPAETRVKDREPFGTRTLWY